MIVMNMITVVIFIVIIIMYMITVVVCYDSNKHDNSCGVL